MEHRNAAFRKASYPTACKDADAILESIAHASRVQPTDLSLMHLSHNTAVTALEYAALYARLMGDGDRLPLSVNNSKVDYESYTFEEGDGRRADIPEIKMAAATVAVTWPPPPCLPTRASEASKEFNALYGAFGLPFPVQKRTDQTEDVKKDMTIFLAHYHLGEENPAHVGNVIAVAAGPHDLLRAFAVGLHQWSSKRAAGVEPSDEEFGMYRLREGEWSRESDRGVRRLESVFLPKSMKEEMMRDVRSFFSQKSMNWYEGHGIPYRRAYLLHGPPGTGKTSLVRALASELRRNVCFLSMGNMSSCNEGLADAVCSLPERPLLVIEDVDAVFESAESSRVSFSALLNVLDGVISAEGVLTIMTTNHPDRLDAAAIRAGRVDRTFHLGPAADDVIAECFRSFYKNADDSTVARFVKIVGDRTRLVEARSIATLQELFIEMQLASAAECVDGTENFLNSLAERKKFMEHAKHMDKKEDIVSDGEEEEAIEQLLMKETKRRRVR